MSSFLIVLLLQGKAGSEPTVEELASALESHDLFIYFGHGSGKVSENTSKIIHNAYIIFVIACQSYIYNGG
jgi:separase